MFTSLTKIVPIISLLVGIITLLWMEQRFWATPKSSRKLQDTFMIHRKRYTKQALKNQAKGNYVYLGKEIHPQQPYIIEERDRYTHFAIVGRSGIGKSTVLKSMIKQDIGRRWNIHGSIVGKNAVVIFDAQKDMTEYILALCARYNRAYVVFPGVGFNPLAGEGSAQERAAIFADLIKQVGESGESAGAKFYVEVEQMFVRTIIPLFERVYGKHITLDELLHLAEDGTKREILREQVRAQGTPELAAYIRHIYAVWPEKSYHERLIGLISFIHRMQVDTRASQLNNRNALTLGECIEKRMVIIIREGGDSGTQERTAGLFYAVSLQHFINHRQIPLDDDTKPPPLQKPMVGVYLDEAHYFFHHGFPQLFATARKKKVALHLGFQNLSQLHPFTETILGNVGTLVFCGALSAGDATYVAEQIGHREFIVEGKAFDEAMQATSSQHTPTYDYLYPPHKIRYLAKHKMLVIAVKDRELQAATEVQRPHAEQLQTVPYQEPPASVFPPPSIWDEMEEIALQVEGSVSLDE